MKKSAKEMAEFVREKYLPALVENEKSLEHIFSLVKKDNYMFTITYENQISHQWSSEFIFSDFTSARDYLINKGFIEHNRLFFRENYQWSDYTKAYIVRRKILS